MNFFENQKVARGKTKLLVFLFVLAVFSLNFALYTAARFVLFKSTPNALINGNWWPTPFWDLNLLLIVSAINSGVILLGSFWRVYQLSSNGGTKIAELMGGRPILPNTTDTNERKLLNIVEEMSIASGIMMPKVYVLDHERAINAFVSGNSPNTSVISVSRGAIQLLNRDELQGVIAHEFSHIFNGDVKLNIRLLGLLNGILMIAVAGETFLRFSGSKKRGYSRSDSRGDSLSLYLALFGFLVMTIGYLGVFFARLIQLAVSRQREFLADASAVQFTRLTSGISGALQKIGGLEYRSHLRSPFTSMTSHMLFADGIKHRFTDLMSTHPNLSVRIKKIDPSFIGHYPKIEYVSDRIFTASESAPQATPSPHAKPLGAFTQNTTSSVLQKPLSPITNQPVLTQPQEFLNLVGVVTANSLTLAQNFIDEQPALVKEMIRDPLGARSIVYALLFDERDHFRTRQINLVRNFENKAVIDTLNKFIWNKIELPSSKLTMLELCLPALRQMSAQQYQQFREILQKVMKVDDHISIYEFSLYSTLTSYLNRNFEINNGKNKKLTVEQGLYPTVTMLLAQLASLTQNTPLESYEAFKVGANEFKLPPESYFSESNFPAANLEDFDLSLGLIYNLDKNYAAWLLKACVAIVMFNHSVSNNEYDLIRTIATQLELPMPMIN